jgi:diguanylate cyclase (GGDEF)-like protein/PAS domain S-box-containing protein
VDDRLWGLTACHHRVPKELPIRLRRACYALAIDVGSMVGLSLQRHSAAVAADVMQAQNRIVDIFNQAQVPLAEVIEQTGAALLRITGATGGALWRGKTVLAFGVWPEGARGESILKYLMHAFETSGEELLCTEKAPLQPALKSEELRSVCGVMAIRLEALAASGIAWIRPEFRREVAWGGDPDKPMQMDLDAEGRPKLSPRSSFARWETIVKGRCRPWSDQDRAAAATLLTLRQVLAVRDSLAQVSLSDRHLRSLVALQSDAYWQVDPRGTLVALSKPLPAWEGPVEGRTLLQLFEPSCEREDIDALDRALRSRKPFRALHLRGRHGTDGRAFEVLLNGEPIRDQGGRSAGWHGTITDVTDEATTQAALRQREVEQQAMLDNDLIGIVKLRDRHFVWKNRAMDRIFGYGPDELYGKSSRILYGDDNTFEAVAEAPQAVLQAGGFYRTQLQMLRKDGNPIWIDVNGALVSVEHQESMWLLVDITPIKESQQQVEHLAFHDGLTGLPNRHLLADRLNQAQALARRQGRSLAVCYVDLDGFKQVNDSYGHAAGDQLLREVARRLQRSVRVIDTVCRVGGDEFVLLLTQLEHGAECEAMLRRVVAEIERPVILDDGRVAQVSATVGAAIFPRDGQQADMLLRNADRAMYEGKQRGRNRVCMYQEERTDP